MKKTMVIIMLLLLTTAAATVAGDPFMLGKPRQQVIDAHKRVYTDFILVMNNDSTLSYHNWRTGNLVTYHFKNRVVERFTMIMDDASANQLIADHHHDWNPLVDLAWTCSYPGYRVPLKVEMEYVDLDRVRFTYTLYHR